MNVYPIAYFPPIPWWTQVSREEVCTLEVFQHYRKQQYTNRAMIRVSNRILPLTIPIERRSARMPILRKKISYAENWQQHHWKSLVSAYRNSPYFEFYSDELSVFFSTKPVFLVEHLLNILEWLSTKLNIEVKWEQTENYHEAEHYVHDFRTSFDPSLREVPTWFKEVPYQQVFPGFIAGLSILDLLFNEGPQSRLVLQASLID